MAIEHEEKEHVEDIVEETIDDDDIDDDDDDDDDDDESVDMSSLLYSVLTTEDGESIATTLQSIRDGIDKQNKILYKLLLVLEKK